MAKARPTSGKSSGSPKRNAPRGGQRNASRQRNNSGGNAQSLTATDRLFIADLQHMTIKELRDTAKKEELKEYSQLNKQDLLFAILKQRCNRDGLMYGEGVLEVLPDGFGFLRSPDYNYMPSPDDIYISPSQIRRFGLRTGCVVQGQIRPPKEGERYFALLRVELINHEPPEVIHEKIPFDESSVNGWYLYTANYCLDLIRAGYLIYVLPYTICHESTGPSDPNAYEGARQDLIARHRDHLPVIYTTIGTWKT